MARALILDFNRTLYDPEAEALFPGVLDFLRESSAQRNLYLYSKREGGRDTLVDDLGISDFFEKIYFTEKKDAASMREILAAHDMALEDCYVVGDLMTSELQAGHEVGMETIWIRQGKFADEMGTFEPTHTVRSVRELQNLLKGLP